MNLPTPDATAEMAAAEPCIRSAKLYARDDLPIERTYFEAAIIAGKRQYALAVLRELDQHEQSCGDHVGYTNAHYIRELEQELERGAAAGVKS